LPEARAREERHIEAMGGELEVIARFPDGAVRISTFSEIGKHPKR
jgi:hypothetical protein